MTGETKSDRELVAAARRGDQLAFEQLVEPFRAALHAHCYRILGSVADADDALQEALIGAWRGIAGFEQRSSVRSWLYTIATHAALRLAGRRGPRVVSLDHFPPADPRAAVGDLQHEIAWLEPYPEPRYAVAGRSPEARYSESESVELAFVVALQQLPANQRAVLLLREVIGFSAEESAVALSTSVTAVNSALQRARRTLDQRMKDGTQEQVRIGLGDERFRALVNRFVLAWQQSDVDRIVAMLAEDATFTMPPLAAWFEGRDAIGVFLAEQVFARKWRMVPSRCNGQPGLACYMWDEATASYPLSVINTFAFRGEQVSAISAFLNPTWLARSGLPMHAR